MENDSERLKALRNQAEQLLRESPEGLKDTPAEDIQDVIHELHVHQIELEMQNEELRRTQLELHATRDKYADLYDFAPCGYLSVSDKGLIQEVNLTGAAMLGVERGKLIGQPLSGFITSDDQEAFYFHRRKLIETRTKQSCELRLMKKNGPEFYAQLECVVVEDDKGNIEFFRAALSDIEERKQAEGVLLESEEKLRAITGASADGIVLMDNDANVSYWNPGAEKIFGYRAEEVMGREMHQIIAPKGFHDAYREGFKRFRETGQGPAIGKTLEFTAVRKDGTLFPIEVSVSAIQIQGKWHAAGIIRDVSDRKRMEEELVRASKFESISILAGGVAHEFNNALMGIMGNLELLKMDLPEDEGRDKSFKAMTGSGHRMSRLTSQLLAYAQGGKYQPRDLRLDDFMIETVPILQHELNPEVRVETHFPKDISYIKADHTQMQMLLSVILTNSNEAIEDEGLIKITAENRDVDEDIIKQHTGLKPGSYVCLIIEDDGEGMDEEARKRIFEPFFTTKFQGRGMGMAAVYGIVKNHGGWIFVDSELSRGTVVRIYLPAIEAKEEVREEAVLRPTMELATGEGTILVIEDEEPLVEMFREILERLGYRVLQARTGKEAVELAKTFDGQIDLALLDIKLPDMEGGKVYPLIMEARPDLKVIVCSGYSIHGPAQDILDAGAEGFIKKPFSMSTFADKLKEVLEGKSGIILENEHF